MTCPCQHCSGKIEFDANQLDPAENTTVPCPHCELETMIFVPEQKVPPVVSSDEDFHLRPAREVEHEEEMRKISMAADTQINLENTHAQNDGVPPVLAGESSSKQSMQENRRTWTTYEAMRLDAERGDPQAQCYLGFCFNNGLGGEQNFTEAVNWFKRSAEQGDPIGQFYLAVCYSMGTGVPVDLPEAMKWWRKAAEQGHPDAQLNLGIAYWQGEGVSVDFTESIKWLRMAAEQGNSEAQNNLGVAYNTGNGVSKDINEALKWWREAADQGNQDSQLTLGYFYWRGEKVSKDCAEAVKWFSLAAEQGNPEAQSMLGKAYCKGIGVTTSYAEAVKWWLKAAEQGNSDAQIGLGIAYYCGEGVPQNYVEAYKWANLAAAAGVDYAKELRSTLTQQMSSSQIEEGQRLASKERFKIQNPTNHAVQERQSRAAIPSEVRREVWRRDGGVCVKCGSRRNLEYDHIVPVSKGGSNTVRNIELLCETCNRSKSASIQ